ncbi:MAG: hypothetical protein IPG81_27375 [Sandaracinaceae bacterium]|nr:hypothetical protein [Sandaracinaceae bacterium]
MALALGRLDGALTLHVGFRGESCRVALIALCSDHLLLLAERLLQCGELCSQRAELFAVLTRGLGAHLRGMRLPHRVRGRELLLQRLDARVRGG